MPLVGIPEILEDLRAGKPVLLVDDEDRENEGDLVVPAEAVTPEHVNFMATHGRGLICLALTRERAAHLELPLQAPQSGAPERTAFTVSIGARHGVSNGVSAHDRATTIRTAIDPGSGPAELVRPGHVFPLIARDGGVLVGAGHTEGSVDLARLAGMRPAGVICEVLNDDGSMARRPDLEVFAERFGLRISSIAELIKYRRQHDVLVERVAESEAALRYGRFRVLVYRDRIHGDEHVALVKGDARGEPAPLVRVQGSTVLGELLGLLSRGEAHPLARALARVEAEGRGVVVCLSMHEGGAHAPRIGDVVRALGEQGAAPALGRPADLRQYGVGAQILADLGVHRMRLLSDHPRRIVGLEGFDLEVVETVPLAPAEGATVRALRS